MAKSPNQVIENNAAHVQDPARWAKAVTKDDANDLPLGVRGVYVGVSGDLSVKMREGDDVIVFVGLAAGIWHPMAVRRIMVASTATNIVVGG